jgi:hypothetical protein
VPDPFTVVTRYLLEGSLRFDRSAPEATTSPDWKPGSRVTAEVRAVLDPSQALLQIDNKVIDAKLPQTVKVGDRLPLRVVENSTKLVFSIETEDRPAADPNRTQVSLSSAAKIIGDVLRPANAQQTNNTLRLSTPFPSPAQAGDVSPEEIATRLKQTIDRSGLFYEKHLARWTTGNFPLAELKQEPQAKLSRTFASSPAVVEAPQTQKVEQAEQLSTAGVSRQLSDEASNSTTRDMSSAKSNSDSPLQAQLDLLEGKPVVVSLPGWSQQEVYWELPHREEEGNEQRQAQAWSTQLSLTLPGLGAVSAQIRLLGEEVMLNVRTASQETEHKLVSQQVDLADALNSVGLHLTRFAVTQDA